jgi:hypothetical protein
MSEILQGRDEEQGFSGPNKEQPQGKGRQRQGCSITGDQMPGGEAEKKEAWRGVPWADFTARRSRYRQFRFS